MGSQKKALNGKMKLAMALEFALLMGGAVVTEIIFGVPGMGK